MEKIGNESISENSELKKEVSDSKKVSQIKKDNKKNKNYIWLIALILLVVIGLYFFSPIKSFITGNVIKDNNDLTKNSTDNIFKELEEKIGFQGVRDPIDKSKSSLVIKGVAYGFSREITFESWSGDILIENNNIIGFEGIIEASSINTQSKWVEEKLKEEVLNVKKYPKIKFKYLSLESNEEKSEVIGDLTFLGRTQEIRIPVSIDEQSISGDFILDLRSFRIESERVSKDVRVIFKFHK